MPLPLDAEHLDVTVGGLAREELRARLDARGVLLNAHAEQLLADAACDEPVEHVAVVHLSVADLGFPAGATLPQLFVGAQEQGLALCPPLTGPYLRLAMADQASAPDAVLSSGRAPSGSLTVASPVLGDDDEYPKGFYLRVIDGRPWLRGYRCDDEHLFSPDDRFAFRRP
ncbi:hypothetical protein ACFT30_10675 [Microbacterium ureisolvens]|uniref:hypothetical protein n=1 Tax=Microbacterium ureisolvens TaxID=2781186 RepID=UPI003629219A